MQTHDEGKVVFESGSASAPLPISQIAIVVRDIDDALEKYHRVLGWGPWNVYEHKPPSLHDTYLHGQPTDYTMIGAETHVGPIVVELLQPVDGPSTGCSSSTTIGPTCVSAPIIVYSVGCPCRYVSWSDGGLCS